MNRPTNRPLTLIILDGFGYRSNPDDNAIAAAKKPNWDRFIAAHPHSYIEGSGKCVGLPEGQMGNSEVGHLNMGAGRVVYQDLTRIDLAIENGDFFANPVLNDALLLAKQQKKAVHVMGLLSPGGVHSHEKHLHAIIELASKVNVPSLYLHAFLDGRDTPPKSALKSIKALDATCQKFHCGQIASLIGRYYAMDRDKRFERIQKAYDLLTVGAADFEATSAIDGLALAYERGETDEFVQATRIVPDQKKPTLAQFICLSTYDQRFNLPVAFASVTLKNLLGSYLSELGLKQLRIAETEKYAHVTFFFNGGIEKPYHNEERILVPSLKIPTYDTAPEMSAPAITGHLLLAGA